mmetsp:Transcript_31525/g.102715  ORF Transcript_31525/g.102715 Transcript_31525/m.102715 type:complete len:338 (-) Transcript_31525:61-1074(-)|eukprot:CAMPEP_0170144108 /NCGR_PEP_ID=MMETSP0033_2-20121228/13306_1 /TAXON_ID=195969 /ORGANISM="Dolichomastix tenuilepis, Strain CCMP3274" /LENGTH=337 /DNA_ID=CAMNT_0010380589 /DNA_START=162 /DNA_END=1175 /DNA_ORIENTATION=+
MGAGGDGAEVLSVADPNETREEPDALTAMAESLEVSNAETSFFFSMLSLDSMHNLRLDVHDEENGPEAIKELFAGDPTAHQAMLKLMLLLKQARELPSTLAYGQNAFSSFSTQQTYFGNALLYLSSRDEPMGATAVTDFFADAFDELVPKFGTTVDVPEPEAKVAEKTFLWKFGKQQLCTSVTAKEFAETATDRAKEFAEQMDSVYKTYVRKQTDHYREAKRKWFYHREQLKAEQARQFALQKKELRDQGKTEKYIAKVLPDETAATVNPELLDNLTKQESGWKHLSPKIVQAATALHKEYLPKYIDVISQYKNASDRALAEVCEDLRSESLAKLEE